MSASPCDVACGNNVVPSAQWANITSRGPSGATSLRAKRVTSLLRRQKHHLFTAQVFDFDIELLYGRPTRSALFIFFPPKSTKSEKSVQKSHDKNQRSTPHYGAFFLFLCQKECFFSLSCAFAPFPVTKNAKPTNCLRHFPRAKRSKIMKNTKSRKVTA